MLNNAIKMCYSRKSYLALLMSCHVISCSQEAQRSWKSCLLSFTSPVRIPERGGIESNCGGNEEKSIDLNQKVILKKVLIFMYHTV